MSDSTQTVKTLKLLLIENSRRLHSIEEDSCSRISRLHNELLQIRFEALIFLKAQRENQFKLQRAMSDKELNQEVRSVMGNNDSTEDVSSLGEADSHNQPSYSSPPEGSETDTVLSTSVGDESIHTESDDSEPYAEQPLQTIMDDGSSCSLAPQQLSEVEHQYDHGDISEHVVHLVHTATYPLPVTTITSDVPNDAGLQGPHRPGHASEAQQGGRVPQGQPRLKSSFVRAHVDAPRWKTVAARVQYPNGCSQEPYDSCDLSDTDHADPDIEPEPDPDIYGVGYPEQLTQ